MRPVAASEVSFKKNVGELYNTALRCREDESIDLPGHSLIQETRLLSKADQL